MAIAEGITIVAVLASAAIVAAVSSLGLMAGIAWGLWAYRSTYARPPAGDIAVRRYCGWLSAP